MPSDTSRSLLRAIDPARLGSASRAAIEQIRLQEAGVDLTGYCMLPDCGCDGEEHEM